VQTTIPDEPASTATFKARAMDAGRRAAHTLTDVLDTASRRVRDHDLRGAMTDVRRFVEQRPGAALITAAFIGFVLARSFARR